MSHRIVETEWAHPVRNRALRKPLRWLKERVERFDLHRLASVNFQRQAWVDVGTVKCLHGSAFGHLQIHAYNPFRITAYYYYHPLTIPIESPRPSLYRGDDGHWAPARSNKSIAIATWDDRILDAFSAVCMTGNSAMIEQFIADYTRGGSCFEQIVNRPGIGEMLKCYSLIRLPTQPEQVVYGFSHAFYQFARRTKQLPGRLHEVHAAAHARAELAAWRRHVAALEREQAPTPPPTVEGFPGSNGTEGRLVGFPGSNGTWRK